MRFYRRVLSLALPYYKRRTSSLKQRLRTPSSLRRERWGPLARPTSQVEQRLPSQVHKSIAKEEARVSLETSNTRGFLSGSTIDHRINRRAKAQALRLRVLFADPQTDVASGVTRSRNMRSRCRCSMCPAIHINSRSWLRSSSTHEPSDPPLRVISFFFWLPNPSWLRCKRKKELESTTVRQRTRRIDPQSTLTSNGEKTAIPKAHRRRQFWYTQENICGSGMSSWGRRPRLVPL